VFSKPGLHRFHHSTDAREGNQNYGAILSAWDTAFGTFPPGRPRLRGPDRARSAAALPADYLGQLAAPFRWARIVRENGADRRGA
jgi:ornithine lipid hydroxylase